MRRSDAAWLGAIGTLIAADVWCDRQQNESTLSDTTRRIFNVDTPEGRAAFSLAWLGFSVWYQLHVPRLRLRRQR